MGWKSMIKHTIAWLWLVHWAIVVRWGKVGQPQLGILPEICTATLATLKQTRHKSEGTRLLETFPEICEDKSHQLRTSLGTAWTWGHTCPSNNNDEMKPSSFSVYEQTANGHAERATDSNGSWTALLVTRSAIDSVSMAWSFTLQDRLSSTDLSVTLPLSWSFLLGTAIDPLSLICASISYHELPDISKMRLDSTTLWTECVWAEWTAQRIYTTFRGNELELCNLNLMPFLDDSRTYYLWTKHFPQSDEF